MTDLTIMPENYENIRSGIVELLKAARSAAARNVNSIMTATYWEIGRRIVQTEQQGESRADYGEQLIERLAVDLTKQFGRGFGNASLWRMRAFFLAWPEDRILATVLRESSNSSAINAIRERGPSVDQLAACFSLPWSAYIRLLAVKKPEARNFYEAEALRAGWTVRQLDRQITVLRTYRSF